MNDSITQGRLDLLTRQVNALTNRLNALAAVVPTAYVRLWNAPLLDGGEIRVAGGTAAAVTVQPGQFYLGYLPFNVGSYDLSITFTAGGSLVTLPVTLAAGKFYTVLMTSISSHVGARLLEDQHVPTDPAKPNLFRVFQLCPGYSAQVLVAISDDDGGPISTDTLDFGEDQFLELPEEPTASGDSEAGFGLSFSGTDPDGTLHSWNTATSFISGGTSMNTAIMYLDAYGRFRPRVFVDGPPSDD